MQQTLLEEYYTSKNNITVVYEVDGFGKHFPHKNLRNLLVTKVHKKPFHTLPVRASIGIRDFHFPWHASVEHTFAYLQNHPQMQPKVHS